MSVPAMFAVAIVMNIGSQVVNYFEASAAAASRNAYLESAARSAEQTGKVNRGVMEANARMVEQKSLLQQQLGEKVYAGQEELGTVEAGKIRAAYGNMGVDPNYLEGSPMDVLKQTAKDYNTRASAEKWQYDYAAWELEEQGVDFRRKGLMYEQQGQLQGWSLRSQKASGPSALGTLFGIGSTAALGYVGYNKIGGFGLGGGSGVFSSTARSSVVQTYP